MKRVTVALFLIANFQSFAFGAFSVKTNSVLYKPYQLSRGKGAEYTKKTKTALEKNDGILLS